MFRLRVLQALHGDCLILEYGAPDDRRFMLIDGGPSTVYHDHLKAELLLISRQGGRVNLAVLSHVDDDHVNGLLDLLHDLVDELRAGQPVTITVDGLWHNSFSQTLGPVLERGFARQVADAPLPRGLMPGLEVQARSISQGDELAAYARGLKIPINVEFKDTPDRLACTDNTRVPIQVGNLSISVIGPTRKSLEALQKEWEDWLARQAKVRALPEGEMEIAARALDMSVPNLSSIMLLVRAEGKTILLTGDGRGDQLLEGMQQAGLLDANGAFHADVFKLPHHGSSRNVTLELFERITADTYVVCADGKYGNPDFQTLEWLVQAASRQGRTFTLAATSRTPSTDRLLQQYDPAQFGYRLEILPPGAHSLVLELSANAPELPRSVDMLKGIGPVYARRLRDAGILTAEQMLALGYRRLAEILNTGENRARNILEAAGNGA